MISESADGEKYTPGISKLISTDRQDKMTGINNAIRNHLLNRKEIHKFFFTCSLSLYFVSRKAVNPGKNMYKAAKGTYNIELILNPDKYAMHALIQLTKNVNIMNRITFFMIVIVLVKYVYLIYSGKNREVGKEQLPYRSEC